MININEADCTESNARAFKDAIAFLRENPSSLLVERPANLSDLDFTDGERLFALKEFVEKTTAGKIQDIYYRKLPRRGFSSWLFHVGDGNYQIALDDEQINEWEKETGLPAGVQKIRSILHEVGHYHLSKGAQPNEGSGPAFFKDSEPYEETQAWHYAMSFLGIVIGSYAADARDSNKPDDSAKLPL